MSAVKLLSTRTVEKVWGREQLPAPFTVPAGKRIGEIWFEPDAELPDLLVKYLFTSEKLSVQVHPSDAQAPAGMRGKEECWLVLEAVPGAKLAIGFREEIDGDTMRAAALDGSIEGLLRWFEPGPGDFFYLDAGTVHAIGPGLSLIEIQQNSDITYRLYDYGRPRELHLDDAIAVADGAAHPEHLRRSLQPGESAVLVDGPHFRLERCVGTPGAATLARFRNRSLVIPVRGEIRAVNHRIAAGACAQVDGIEELMFEPDGETLLACPI